MDLTLIVVLVIALALFFDFTNGFHDTANAMATPIATGALRPKVAVGIAAILNLIGAFLSTEVAMTISGGIINEGDDGVLITPELIFAGLIGAIVWNMITWLLGLPSSSSHALFGGLIGAAIVGFGVGAIDFCVVLSKVILPADPGAGHGGLIAYTATKLAYAITRRYDGKPDGRDGFRHAQIFSALAGRPRARHERRAEDHGHHHPHADRRRRSSPRTTSRRSGSSSPARSRSRSARTWAAGASSRPSAPASPTIKPAQGFAAETATAATILASTHLGFALSTTQVASGSVIGSGIGRRGSKVRWRTAGRIGVGWLLTLPAAGVVGALAAIVGPRGHRRHHRRRRRRRSSSASSSGRAAARCPPTTW